VPLPYDPSLIGYYVSLARESSSLFTSLALMDAAIAFRRFSELNIAVSQVAPEELLEFSTPEPINLLLWVPLEWALDYIVWFVYSYAAFPVIGVAEHAHKLLGDVTMKYLTVIVDSFPTNNPVRDPLSVVKELVKLGVRVQKYAEEVLSGPIRMLLGFLGVEGSRVSDWVVKVVSSYVGAKIAREVGAYEMVFLLDLPYRTEWLMAFVGPFSVGLEYFLGPYPLDVQPVLTYNPFVALWDKSLADRVNLAFYVASYMFSVARRELATGAAALGALGAALTGAGVVAAFLERCVVLMEMEKFE